MSFGFIVEFYILMCLSGENKILLKRAPHHQLRVDKCCCDVEINVPLDRSKEEMFPLTC